MRMKTSFDGTTPRYCQRLALLIPLVLHMTEILCRSSNVAGTCHQWRGREKTSKRRMKQVKNNPFEMDGSTSRQEDLKSVTRVGRAYAVNQIIGQVVVWF